LTGESTNPNEEKELILTVMRFRKSIEKHQKDIDIWSAAREKKNYESSRLWISEIQKLEMKISDIEFQGDGSKAVLLHGKWQSRF
jgi:hypothetical protein